MARVVLDASAVLAFVHREPGAEDVAEVLVASVISSVNLTEVVSKLFDKGMSKTDIKEVIDDLPIEVATFDREMAFKDGEMRNTTRVYGLSLGDRACLALAERDELAAMTADRAWADLDIGIEIRSP